MVCNLFCNGNTFSLLYIIIWNRVILFETRCIYTVYMISYNMPVPVNKSNFCNLKLPCIPTVQSDMHWLNTSTAATLARYPQLWMVTRIKESEAKCTCSVAAFLRTESCLGWVAWGGVLLTVRSGLSAKQKHPLCFENCLYYYQNAVCFIMLTCLVPVLFTFYIQSVLKIKKNNSGAKELISSKNKLRIIS